VEGIMKTKQATRTKGEIFAAAVMCAQRDGLYTMTRSSVAKVAKTATGTVSFHYGDMTELRRAVIRHCIAHPTVPNCKVLAQALSVKDTIAVRAPAEIKRAALNTLA
jgi:AcrR family transcriptional regulator